MSSGTNMPNTNTATVAVLLMVASPVNSFAGYLQIEPVSAHYTRRMADETERLFPDRSQA